MKANKRWGCSSTGRALFYIRTIKVCGSTPRISKKNILVFIIFHLQKKYKNVYSAKLKESWGCSSIGRAFQMHDKGSGFNSSHLQKLFLFNLSSIYRKNIN